MTFKASGGIHSRVSVANWRSEVAAEYPVLPLTGALVTDEYGRDIRLPDFKEQVKRGAKLMDRHFPGWFTHIDTSSLNLKDEDHCVLGQTWQHYAQWQHIPERTRRSRFASFASRLFGTDDATEDRDHAARYGFSISKRDGKLLNYQVDWQHENAVWRIAWEKLTKTWLREIDKRQKAAQLTEPVR